MKKMFERETQMKKKFEREIQMENIFCARSLKLRKWIGKYMNYW